MTEGKSPRWNALRLRGLRQRWIVNTVMPVLVLLILLMTLFSAGVSSYYYRSMQNGLEKQAQALASAFDDYFMDNGFAEYSRKAEQTAIPMRTRTVSNCSLSAAAGVSRCPLPA